MYAAKGAAEALAHAADRRGSAQHLATAFEDFGGAAGVVRFHDGAVEAEVASAGLDHGLGGAGRDRGPDVTTLPGTTAAVLSLALPDGWLDGPTAALRSLLGDSYYSLLGRAERRTGLELPGDLETLLGEGVSVSVDSSADPSAVAGASDPADVPAGVRIRGDAGAITAIIDKLEAAAGPGADGLHVASSGDLVAVSTDKAYADALLGKGDLGDAESFTDAVPDADRAGGVLFLDFDAGDGWAEKVADLLSDEDASVRENLRPLDALGISGWTEGDVQHTLLRLTTD
jgi:hypothetical protein